jgi:hypothetical protein
MTSSSIGRMQMEIGRVEDLGMFPDPHESPLPRSKTRKLRWVRWDEVLMTAAVLFIAALVLAAPQVPF